MADAVSSVTLIDTLGTQNLLVMRFRNQSDGTGESGVVKVDVSTLEGGSTSTRVNLQKVVWSCTGMAVNILWDATTPVLAFGCPADSSGEFVFKPPLKNNAGSGITGDIKFTTVGHTASDTYFIDLHMKREVVA